MSCRTRFAPSPTGYLHIGGARTALYCYLEARHRNGQFILRVEDTDRERSTAESVKAILDGMSWLGLAYDEGPIYQTQRLDRYRAVAEALVAAGKAYYAYESREELDQMREAQMQEGLKPRYNGYWRERKASGDDPGNPNRVIRFKSPEYGVMVFHDRVRGRIEVANEELDDLIIWRSDRHPTYNFAVVVDDIDMRITDVIRGDDHLNNTPRQIHIYEALGKTVPSFAHLPMIHGADGTKLSKRHGAVGVMQYRDEGYLPHALLNYLLRLGWSFGDQEIFSMAEMIEHFSVDDVNKSAARFDTAKLDWLNQHYLKNEDPRTLIPLYEEQLRMLGLNPATGPKSAEVIAAMRERVKTLKEMAERSRFWYEDIQQYDQQSVAKHLGGGAVEALNAAREQLSAIPTEQWLPEQINLALKNAATHLNQGLGKIAQPLRVAMTGHATSPSIDHTVYLVGKKRALARIEQALSRIKN